MPSLGRTVQRKQTYEQALLSLSGCVGYWPLDEPSGATARNLFGSNVGTYTGTAATVTSGANATDIVTNSGTNGFVAGVPIQFTALSGGAGITLGRTYYVIAANLTTTTFQFSIAPGGAAFDFTSDIVSATVIQLIVQGKAGGVDGAPGVAFNGVDQYVTIPDAAAYSLSTTNALSIVIDVLTTATDTLAWVAKGTANNHEWRMRQFAAGPVAPDIIVYAAAGTTIADATSASVTVAWHNFVATMDNVGKFLNLYSDGVLIASQAVWSGTAADGTSPVNVGRAPDGSVPFNGSARRLAIFNRVLSPNDVAYLAAVQRGA